MPYGGFGKATTGVKSMLERIAKLRLFGKSPARAYLRLNEWIWRYLPNSVAMNPAIQGYGRFLHSLVCLDANRRQFFGTFFLRNRPQLELIRRLCAQNRNGAPLNIAVLGCSNGAEVYSILWTIRSVRPDLKILVNAVDISKEVLELAQKGVYSLKAPELVGELIFKRMAEEEIREMFDIEGDHVKIKEWIKDGIFWRTGDAGDPGILNALGPQDVVVANNFLCHMVPEEAERCLRNIRRLVKPGGYLVVSGIDLDVRTKVASDLGLEPTVDLLEEIHNGDSRLRREWPWQYWGLEPLDKSRRDWKTRYASIFQATSRY